MKPLLLTIFLFITGIALAQDSISLFNAGAFSIYMDLPERCDTIGYSFCGDISVEEVELPNNSSRITMRDFLNIRLRGYDLGESLKMDTVTEVNDREFGVLSWSDGDYFGWSRSAHAFTMVDDKMVVVYMMKYAEKRETQDEFIATLFQKLKTFRIEK